jgi:hypothetical protein
MHVGQPVGTGSAQMANACGRLLGTLLSGVLYQRFFFRLLPGGLLAWRAEASAEAGSNPA